MGKRHRGGRGRRRSPIITTGQRHLLPLEALDPATFERLCMWILVGSGFEDVAHYGDAGADAGRDVTARDANGNNWVLQAKRTQLGSASACKALEQAARVSRPYGVIIASSHRLSAATRDALDAKATELGVKCIAWSRTELDERVKESPEIIEEFFLKR